MRSGTRLPPVRQAVRPVEGNGRQPTLSQTVSDPFCWIMNSRFSSAELDPHEVIHVFAPAWPAPVAARRILLLDDDEHCRRPMTLALSRCGYVVAAAVDGEQGWRALCSDHYDLLITDYDMPKLDGLAVASRARRAGFNLPIILMTGSFDYEKSPDFHQQTLAAVFQKPFPLRNLTAMVQRMLSPSDVIELPRRADTHPEDCASRPTGEPQELEHVRYA